MLSKWKSRFGILAVLAMIATVLAIVPASAVTTGGGGGSVDTGAVIGSGNGLAPQIICKWELPDRDRNAENGMQYGDDDAPNNDAGFPCNGIDPNTKYDADGRTVMEVKANAEDYPTERLIELWSAVKGSANAGAIDSVIWDIYHPDGTLKKQVESYEPDSRSPQALGAKFNLATGKYALIPGGMWYAASAQTGQIANDTATSQQGIISRAVQDDLSLWSNSFLLSKHQPCGTYTVVERATYLGWTSTVTNNIEVLCFVNLEADFNSVQWGDITPGGTDYVYGDLVFDPQGNSPWPTVKNTGSGAMTLSIMFSEMRAKGDTDPNSVKLITEFDGKFGISPDRLRGIDPIEAGVKAWFGDGDYQTLCANETGKLDLSIHPPSGLPAGTYLGSLTLYAGWANNGEESPCLNEQGVWNPPYVRGKYVAPSVG